MAHEMCFRVVGDAELGRFRREPKSLPRFFRGKSSEAPGVIHSNVDMFHYLLNGTEAPADGPARVFETWFRPERCDDLFIDYGDGAFALASGQTAALLTQLRALSDEMIAARWEELKRKRGIVEDDDDDPYFSECFAALREVCEKAAAAKKGLMWTAG